MCNADIRAEAKQNGVFLYSIAEKMGFSEPTMTRLLRRELSDDKKQEIRRVIAELKTEKTDISEK